MKTIHLVANAHIDPVWLWEWEEGLSATLSTFRSAVKLSSEFDYIFCHNEAILYMWIEKYDAELFCQIKELVKSGKWHIMGGWYLQPDCNMPSGESMVRQMMVGRHYFYKNFGSVPTTAISFDAFGHSRGIVQIMLKCGYDSFLFCRPYPDQLMLEDDSFDWVGFDGNAIRCYRAQMGYLSLCGTALSKIKKYIDLYGKKNDVGTVLWGVGNHGGGPSRKDLSDIDDLINHSDVRIIHSTPEDFFRGLPKPLLKFEKSLYPSMVGCYSSQIQIKQRHRGLENSYYMTEKMCTSAAASGIIDYPMTDLDEALKDLLTSEFHDILPGSAIKAVENSSLRMMDHGIEILNRIKTRAFYALCEGQEEAPRGEYVILVYNPHPIEWRNTVVCEFPLENQNWDDDITDVTIFADEQQQPTQLLKESSNLNLDWHKRVIFEGILRPGVINRFICKVHRHKKRHQPNQQESSFVFSNGIYDFCLNENTGLVDNWFIHGQKILHKNAFTPIVISDNEDPWAMSIKQMKHLGEEIGQFRLMDDAESAEFLGYPGQKIPAIRIVEDGDVIRIIEVAMTYNRSDMIVQYVLYKNSAYFDVNYTVFWNEKNKALKVEVPLAFDGCFVGDAPYGVENLPEEGKEVSFQRWCASQNSDIACAIMNNCIYAGSFEDNTIMLTLLRSPCYAAHPIMDREIVPANRYLPRIDQGEKYFCFRVYCEPFAGFCKSIASLAQQFNELPVSLCVFPSGKGAKPNWFVSIEKSEVIMTTLKRNDEASTILRLFNSTPADIVTKVTIDAEGICEAVRFGKYEVKTMKISDGKVEFTKQLEI